MGFLEKLIRSISSHPLPTACIACQRYQTEPICNACLENLLCNSLIHYECCDQCGIPLLKSELLSKYCDRCNITPPFFDKTYCLDRYDGILQDALHQLKYQKRIAFAHGLSMTWNHVFGSSLNNEADYLLPVPLSNQKLHSRGFNQSWEVARRIDCGERLQHLPYALKRHHHLDRQVGKNRVMREDAIRQMFYIDEKYISRLKNKVVVVFDDVMTTGATLNEIARILKEAGVSSVINWALLRTTRFPK